MLLHCPICSSCSLSLARSRPMFEIILKTDPFMPQAQTDAIITALCARGEHTKHTVSACNAVLPLHSTALYSRRSTAVNERSALRGGDAATLLVVVLSSATAHSEWTVKLVQSLIERQPSELLRSPLSLLVNLALKAVPAHTAHTAALVDVLIEAYKQLDDTLRSITDAFSAAASEYSPQRSTSTAKFTPTAKAGSSAQKSSGHSMAKLAAISGFKQAHSPVAGKPGAKGKGPQCLSHVQSATTQALQMKGALSPPELPLC